MKLLGSLAGLLALGLVANGFGGAIHISRAGISSQGVPYWSDFQRIAGPRAIERAAQVRQESAFQVRAVSHVGARGLAQFMPSTWAQWGRGADPFDPVAGIDAQHRYMIWLEARTWEPAAALAGYNAGLGNVRKAQVVASSMGLTDSRAWLRVGLPRVTGRHAAETQGYVDRIERIHIPWVKARVK
jgi:hypothetical protein